MNKGKEYKKFIPVLGLAGFLVLEGCLPPKTIILLPEPPAVEQPKAVFSEKKSPSEEEIRIEKLIRQLEETEKRFLETQRKTDEALKRVEKASHKTEEAAGRIQKAQEKIEAVDLKETP
jgi:hypothetical protein